MPILLNLCVNLLLGSSIAMVARKSKAMQQNWLSWSSLCLLAFESLCVTPMATFAFRFYPDWSMLYLLDPEVFPNLPYWIGWLSILVVILNFVMATTAYLVTRSGILAQRAAIEFSPLILGASSLLVLTVLFYKRIFFIGDYEAFLAGEAQLMLTTPVGIFGLAVYIMAIGFIIWLAKRFSESDPKFF
jgi:hypothetical protein